jgi:hypothetical protein
MGFLQVEWDNMNSLPLDKRAARTGSMAAQAVFRMGAALCRHALELHLIKIRAWQGSLQVAAAIT